MTKRLRLRVPSLDAIPAQQRQFYVADPAGGFRLAVDGLPDSIEELQPPAPPAPARRPAPEMPSNMPLYRKGELTRAHEAAEDERVAKVKTESPRPLDVARRAVEHHVQLVLERIRPHPDHREEAAEFVRARMRVEMQDDVPVVAFLDEPGGWRLPSGLPKQTWAGVDEFAATLQLPAKMVQPPPDQMTTEQRLIADSVPFQAEPRNVTLTQAQAMDFRNYEAAKALAKSLGGELILVPNTEAPKPPPTFVPNGKDVPLTSAEASNFATYERARELAKSQGGIVQIVDDYMQGKESSAS